MMCNWLVVAGCVGGAVFIGIGLLMYVLLLAAVDIDSRALTPSSEDLVKGKQA